MTVIVLDTDETSVVLAADSMWTEDTDMIFYRNKIAPIMCGSKQIGAMATSGDARKGLKLETAISVAFKSSTKGSNSLELIQGVVDNFNKKLPVCAIILVRGQGFSVDEDGLVLPRDRWSIGSGSMIALGSMWERRGAALRIATLGCKAATALMGSCGGKIYTYEMEREP